MGENTELPNNKKIFFCIASNLALLIPVPGRFAYAIILLVLFNIQMATVTLFFHAIHRMKIGSLQNALLALTIIALGVFYKQVVTLVCPIAAFTLGFCIFLPMLASVIIEFFFLDYSHGLKKHLAANMKKSGFMTVLSLFIFLIRDILGYGTLTLPGFKSIVVFHLPYNPDYVLAASVLATIPGSLGLISLLLLLYIFFAKKFHIFARASKNEAEGAK